MTLAPIALFVYNRPVHTLRTVEALQKNSLAKESDLIIYSDAPKAPRDTEAVRKVREYIRTITGFKSVSIVYRNRNWGLANSIIDGVTSVVNKHGRIIVLEDDLITSPHFLRFMNEALDMYEDEDQVMHISGSTYPIEHMEDETFFLRIPLCWGWGTWSRAWQHFRKSNDVMLRFDRKMRKHFSFNNSYHYWQQLELNKSGAIDTWFVYWYATLFMRRGLALFPRGTLVKNIGFDGSGVHCGSVYSGKDTEPANLAVRIGPIPLKESEEAVMRHERFFQKEYRPPSSIRTLIFRDMLRAIGKLARAIRSVRAEDK
ncbi:MAG TPA: sugar transferase [Candidatus Methanoperedens sp.]